MAGHGVNRHVDQCPHAGPQKHDAPVVEKRRAVAPPDGFAEYRFSRVRHAVERERGEYQKVMQHLVCRQLHVAELGAFRHEKP